jgi:hypothetical protein
MDDIITLRTRILLATKGLHEAVIHVGSGRAGGSRWNVDKGSLVKA